VTNRERDGLGPLRQAQPVEELAHVFRGDRLGDTGDLAGAARAELDAEGVEPRAQLGDVGLAAVANQIGGDVDPIVRPRRREDVTSRALGSPTLLACRTTHAT